MARAAEPSLRGARSQLLGLKIMIIKRLTDGVTRRNDYRLKGRRAGSSAEMAWWMEGSGNRAKPHRTLSYTEATEQHQCQDGAINEGRRTLTSVVVTKSSSACSIATHPCKKPKREAPSVKMMHTEITKGEPPAPWAERIGKDWKWGER